MKLVSEPAALKLPWWKRARRHDILSWSLYYGFGKLRKADVQTSRLSLDGFEEMTGPWRLEEFVVCVGVVGLVVIGSTVVVL